MLLKSKHLKDKKLYANLIIGLGIITIPILSSPDIMDGFGLFKIPAFLRNFISYLILCIFFFVSYYYIIPKFYTAKKWFLLALTIVVAYLFVVKLPQFIITDFLITNLNSQPTGPHPPGAPPGLMPRHHGNPFLDFFLSRENHLVQFLGIFILSLFLRINEDLHKAKNDKLKTEISYLKSQINPHFLFNTLNSLYALALTKPNKVPDAILKLSDLMRYVVTESNQRYISLKKEVTYIKSFIDLQKLRLTENTNLSSSFKGDFEENKITPLLLISFIENAFKYGAAVENKSIITLHFLVKNDVLSLYIENTIVSESKEKSTKRGLYNAKKQLNLFYPDKYSLNIKNDKKTYKVNLKIQLT